MKRLWTICFFLALSWMVLGLILSISATGQTISNAVEPSAVYDVGAGIGGAALSSFFVCTGFPLMCVFGFLWSMSRWKTK